MNNGTFGSIKAFLLRHKLAALLFAVGLIVLIFGEELASSSYKSEKSEDSDVYSNSTKIYTEYLEDKIRALISELEGVTDVTVLLTLDGGSELIYAENSSSGSVDYLIINSDGGEEPVLIREIYSSVRGIAVVCKGGNDASVQRTVTELLASAFDLPHTKISVAGAE